MTISNHQGLWLSESTPFNMWVYLAWVEIWCIRCDKITKQNVSRVSHKKALPAKYSWKPTVWRKIYFAQRYVSFRIWKQECVPWCGEIQNRRSEVLGKTFNLHSNSTWYPRCVVSQSVSNERIKSVQHTYTNHFILCMIWMKDLMKVS